MVLGYLIFIFKNLNNFWLLHWPSCPRCQGRSCYSNNEPLNNAILRIIWLPRINKREKTNLVLYFIPDTKTLYCVCGCVCVWVCVSGGLCVCKKSIGILVKYVSLILKGTFVISKFITKKFFFYFKNFFLFCILSEGVQEMFERGCQHAFDKLI